MTQIAAGVGYSVLVNLATPAYTVKEFIALAKQKSMNYSAPLIKRS